MKVLFATTNPAKIKKYVDKLKEKDIEILTIKDLGINLKPEETGKNAIENAYIKAKTYYDKTKIISIGMDNNLYIEGLPDEKQPGTHVRRINGKELNDEEMIEYYSKLVNEYGGKLTAKWVYGMVIYDGKETNEYSWSKGHFYFIDKPCEKRNPGYPLDSISIMPECNKYFVDLTEEDKNKNQKDYNEALELIKKEINNIINDLKLTDVEVINNENNKYNIKYTSAIIIDNVLIDDANELSYTEMKNVIYQFIET